MKNKTLTLSIFLAFAAAGYIAAVQSCKSCKKEKPSAAPIVTDTTGSVNPNIKTIDAPHGDTSLIPVLAEVLDKAFKAGKQKDYAAFGTYVVYRGADEKRHGYDVFNVKNSYEKNVVRITADVFAKWSTGTQSIDYARVFELPQPDGRTLQVLEVIFVYPKKVDRKFFGFLPINNEYKIADVTSYL